VIARTIGVAFVALAAWAASLAPEASDAMSAAAQAFAKSLDVEQSAAARFRFDDVERRNWHFVPRDRAGLGIGRLNDAQREALSKLVRTALSERGQRTVNEIVELEKVLYELESTPEKPAAWRDATKYYVSIFGEPGEPAWGWRLEGHHVSLNFTSSDGTSFTPHFLGANPASSNHAGVARAPLGPEEQLARKFVRGLNEAERKRGVSETGVPADVLLQPGVSMPFDPSEGLRAGDLGAEARQRLRELLDTYLARFDGPALAAAKARVDEAGDELRFLWIGGTEPGQPHYYRLHSPRFAIEYDNTQNSANHVHTVWRDFERDFGDPLREHVRDEHK
jgi:hypothetical protein